MISLFGVLLCVNIFLICNSNGHLLIDKLRLDFLKLEEDSWKFVLDQYKYGNVNSSDDPGASLISVFENYDQELQKMPPDILYGMEVVRQTSPFLFLYSDLRVVNDMYEKFRRFLKHSMTNDNKNLSVIDEREDKMSYIVEEVLYEPKNNMNKTIANIFQQSFINNEDGDERNLVSHILDIIVDSEYMCKNYKQPPQQVFYHLYNAIALAHLKGYIMIQFSYLAQKLVQEGNFTTQSLIARKQFEISTKNMLLPLGTTMRVLSRKMWRCDPKRQIKGSTYDELTALIQGHIENEVDLNSGGSCTQNCAAYPYAKSYGCFDSGSAYCQKRRSCNGKILNCKFIESDMTACISPYNSPRRFEYIQYESGRVLGKKERCQSKNIDSWNRWFVHCSYCLCLCDQEGLHSDRYFNLRPVLADVANNRVVTGLRIVKHNRIIHLQIQEGKLLPYGYIDPSTVRWVPVDDYKITNRGVQNGIDFHTMNYRERTMFLDDLKPHEENHIITGVRFEYIDNHLKFEINVRSFDFQTGVISKDSYYIYGSGTSSRHQLYIRDPDIPTSSPPSVPHFEQDNYIEFTHTSFDKDAAQTTIPFFDTQPVTVDPPVPLKGAGIYYKGKIGYGGFVAPTITTLDFSTRVKAEFPRIQPREEKEFPILA